MVPGWPAVGGARTAKPAGRWELASAIFAGMTPYIDVIGLAGICMKAADRTGGKRRMTL
jgi:hypothetical protein